MQDATVKAINLLISCSAAMKEKLAENIAIAIADDNTGDLEEINKILTAKQRELVKLAHAKKDYNDLADEIDKIREKKQRILVAKAETEGYKKRIEELQDFINEGDTELSEYDEKIVRKYIKEIRVFDKRLVEKNAVITSLNAAYAKVSQQCCDENTSCYNCLRNYYNQANHSKLKRKYARDFIESLLKQIGVRP